MLGLLGSEIATLRVAVYIVAVILGNLFVIQTASSHKSRSP